MTWTKTEDTRNYEILKRHYDYPLNKCKMKWYKSIRNCNVYKNTNKYILITHFLISNITNFCSYHLHYERFKRALSVVFFFIKQYKSHFFILWVANLVIGKKFFKKCRLNRVFLMKSKTILVKELPLIYRGTTSKI